MRPIVLIAVVLLGALLVVSCDRGSTGTPGTGETPAVEPIRSRADIDKELAASIDTTGSMEARAWLNPANAKHVLWKTWDKPEARKQVDALYTAGAKRVVAIDPVEVNGARVVAQFVVELPDAPDARTKVFEWIKNFESEIEDEDPTKDVGQKFYEINLDL